MDHYTQMPCFLLFQGAHAGFIRSYFCFSIYTAIKKVFFFLRFWTSGLIKVLFQMLLNFPNFGEGFVQRNF